MQIYSAVRRVLSAPLFFRGFILSCLIFACLHAAGQSVAPQYGVWGCKVGNNIYWDWKNTWTDSGGTRYYHFNSSGRYTPWDNDYALREEYRCDRFINSSPAGYSCSVNGTIGQRGNMQTSTTYCPIDNHLAFLCMGLTLFLAYFYRRKKLLKA